MVLDPHFVPPRDIQVVFVGEASAFAQAEGGSVTSGEDADNSHEP
jgi:hypothetical protein